jgi:hypothetical protein
MDKLIGRVVRLKDGRQGTVVASGGQGAYAVDVGDGVLVPIRETNGEPSPMSSKSSGAHSSRPAATQRQPNGQSNPNSNPVSETCYAAAVRSGFVPSPGMSDVAVAVAKAAYIDAVGRNAECTTGMNGGEQAVGGDFPMTEEAPAEPAPRARRERLHAAAGEKETCPGPNFYF